MGPAVERIDFQNPNVGKPSNLQNSAVLRMLEEEENRRGGRAGNGEFYPTSVRDVPWPPPQHDQLNNLRSSFKDVVIPGVKRVAWPPPQEGVLDPAEVVEHNAVPTQGGPQNSNQYPGLPQNNYSPQRAAPYQQPAQPSYRPLKPLDVSSVGTGSPLASPAHNQSPQAYRPATPNRGWSSVQSPVTTPLGPGPQKYFGAPAPGGYSSQPQYQPVAQTYQQPNRGYQEPGRQYTLPAQQYQAAPQSHQQPAGQQYGQPAQQYQQPGSQYQAAPQSYQEPGRQYGQPAQQYQPSVQQYQQPGQYHQAGQFQQPGQFYQPGQLQQPNQYQQLPQQYQTSSSQYQSPQPQSQPAPQQYQSQSFAQPPQNQTPSQPAAAQAQAAPRQQPAKQVEPPPSTITLRPSAPVNQSPAPVYNAQPATATLKGGKHLRGDLKWPPENVRQRMAEDEAHLKELEKGPANRPNKKEKDYSRFFAEHALNSAYPGYKIPPGTQFFRPE